jgi:urocanate hydratase
MGVARHADAGYKEAINLVRKTDIRIPMIKKRMEKKSDLLL